MSTRPQRRSLGAHGIFVATALVIATRAHAYEREWDSERFEIQRTDPALVHSQAGQWTLTRDDDRWDVFRGEHGEAWHVRWNEATRTPHRAFGGTITAAALGLPGPAGAHDKRAILALAEAFVRTHADLLGGIAWNDLRPAFCAFEGGRWCVTLQQTSGGIDVVGGRIDLR